MNDSLGKQPEDLLLYCFRDYRLCDEHQESLDVLYIHKFRKITLALVFLDIFL